MVRGFILQKLNSVLMDFVGVRKGELGLVVAELLWGGDTQLIQGWLQLLKLQSQSQRCNVLFGIGVLTRRGK